MNCCCETTKMGGAPGNRRVCVGFEVYLNGTPQGPTPEDTRKGRPYYSRSLCSA